jgi:hypothetical protein
MIVALKLVIATLGLFTAIGLACAVRHALRRPRLADPFAIPFGEMPGFTDAQLHAIEQRPHPRDPLRRSFSHAYFDDLSVSPGGPSARGNADGGLSSIPSGLAAVRNFLSGLRHA